MSWKLARREFLKGTFAAAGALLVANSSACAATLSVAGTAATPPWRALYDSRFEASVAFGGEMKRLGVPGLHMDGDITQLWLEELEPRWRKTPSVVAGLTTLGVLFCMEQLACSHGMRSVFRAEHRGESGLVQHGIWLTTEVDRQVAEFTYNRPDWPQGSARLALGCSAAAQAQARECLVVASQAEATTMREPLVSWVIAPVHRV